MNGLISRGSLDHTKAKTYIYTLKHKRTRIWRWLHYKLLTSVLIKRMRRLEFPFLFSIKTTKNHESSRCRDTWYIDAYLSMEIQQGDTVDLRIVVVVHINYAILVELGMGYMEKEETRIVFFSRSRGFLDLILYSGSNRSENYRVLSDL